MAYHKEISKLNVEHDLHLVDLDIIHADGSVKSWEVTDREFHTLCRDAKDIWLDDRNRWQQLIKKFNHEAPSLRSSWVNKPNGDPSTLPSRVNSAKAVMTRLFKRLIDEEKARFIPQSTIPFSASQQDAILLAALTEESQGPPNLPSHSTVVHRHAPSSSLDSTFNPPSSWTNAMWQYESDLDAYALHTVGETNEDPDADQMAIDQADTLSIPQKMPVKHQQLHSIQVDEKVSTVLRSSRKRPASTNAPDGELRKRKSNEEYPQQREDDEIPSDFSFTNGRDYLHPGDASNSLSRSTSANTSFKSVGTEVNESFATGITAPSFGLNKAISFSNIDGGRPAPSGNSKNYGEQLLQNSPFVLRDYRTHFDCMSYRVAYECLRVALHNEYDSHDVFQHIQAQPCLLDDLQDVQNLERLWMVLKQYVHQREGSMPAKTSEKAWKISRLTRSDMQYSKVDFSGTMSFEESKRDVHFNFKLNPIKIDQSNRFKRKYGSDRFMVLGFQSLEAVDLPPPLKNNANELRQAVIYWLTTTKHFILGRQWRAFYVKSRPKRKNDDKRPTAWRVYLFAIDGSGFDRSNIGSDEGHKPVNLESMLQWCFSFQDNSSQFLLKLFSRLQLPLSDTTPTLMFKEGKSDVDHSNGVPMKIGQVFHIKDIRHNGNLMTDGCGRISLKAAEEIFEKLGLLPPMPSAFQARVAGAKGMWIIEPNRELHEDCELWIEITESQVKFDSFSRDASYWDRNRITFEVHEYSRPLRSAAINFQLLPILIDRGVNGDVFKDLLSADLDAKVTELEIVMSEPQALRAWNQEQYAAAESRSLSGGIVWEGGMPEEDAEQINALTEAGFTPATCSYLRGLCRESVSLYCKRVEEKMNIYPGKTTFAFMVPDFDGILEEDEIHLGFSSAFVDKRSKWSDTMLNNVDVLVARLPAALPSDIHKVRAVFKPQLSHLKDVVVFPTKGDFCLAEKLSGGDYDGDRAWICWNEAIVKDFKNFPTPKKEHHSYYGIQKDETRVTEILNLDKATQATQFIKAGFEFNMRRSALGRCTNLHASYCYKIVIDAIRSGAQRGKFFSPMREEKAMEFAYLLGYLVDTAKSGFTFTEENCDAYLKSIGAKNLPEPAYKQSNGGQATPHIIDQLVLVEAVKFRQKAIKKLDRIFETSASALGQVKDQDLTRVFRSEEQIAKNDRVVLFVLKTLKEEIRALNTTWDKLIAQCKKGQLSWSEVHCSIREHFLNIVPAETQATADHPLIQRWRQSTTEGSPVLSTQHSWILLKASALYSQYQVGNFPWRACGKELLALKLLAHADGVSISRDMHQYLRFDRRAWDAALLTRSEREDFGGLGEVSRFDEDEFMSQAPEDAYEAQANAE